MRGVLVSHDGLSSLNYVHESYVRNWTLGPFWPLCGPSSASLGFCTGAILPPSPRALSSRTRTELNRPALPSAAP
jgi:hypothetical protein